MFKIETYMKKTLYHYSDDVIDNFSIKNRDAVYFLTKRNDKVGNFYGKNLHKVIAQDLECVQAEDIAKILWSGEELNEILDSLKSGFGWFYKGIEDVINRKAKALCCDAVVYNDYTGDPDTGEHHKSISLVNIEKIKVESILINKHFYNPRVFHNKELRINKYGRFGSNR